MLASGADRLRNVLRLGGGQHKDNVAGGFFQNLEQGVEGGVGDLVRFVQDVDFEAIPGRAIAGCFAEFPDFVDAAVSSGIDLDDVDRVPSANLGARVANPAGFPYGVIRGTAIKGHGQDTGHGGFSNAPMSAEDVSMSDPALFYGIGQGTGNVLLTDNLGELLGAVLAGQDLVAHEEMLRLYVMDKRAPPTEIDRKCHSRLAKRRQPRYSGCPKECVCREEALVQLELSTRSMDGIAVVDCHGRLIFGEESASLRDAVKNLLALNNQIVLNLGGVNYIDSGGLGTLVALYTTARNAGGSIKLAALTQRVGDLLQVTKLLTVFEVYDTVEDAVGSYKKGAAA